MSSPAEEVATTDGQATAEHGEPREPVLVSELSLNLSHFAGEDDGEDDAVNSNSLAEDDATANMSALLLLHPQRRARTYLIRFFVLIRGSFTAPPNRLAPVMKMPQAAPTTEREMAKAVPREA